MKLDEFIIKAKKQGYAGNGKWTNLEDGSKEFTFKEGIWTYKDNYFGFNPFAGREMVWENNNPVWIMHYYGEVIANPFTISDKEVFAFLKICLGLVKKEFPFRGPKFLTQDDFRYRNSFEGDIANFQGQEKIFFKDEAVYTSRYHGGFIA